MNPVYKNSKFTNVINEIKHNNYNNALILLSKINSKPNELYLEKKLYAAIYFKKEDWVKSIEYYYKILQIENKDLVVLNNLGVALFKIGKFNEAINIFKKLLKIEKRPFNVYRSLGLAFKNIGKYEEAISNFLQALKIDGNNNSIKQDLINICNYHIPNETKNNDILNLNNKIIDLNDNLNFKNLIDDKFIKEFVIKNFDLLGKFKIDYEESQIFRRNQTNLNCDRHFKVFNKFKIIPKYCFNCFKVQINLKNVKDLIKLFFVFNKIELKKNNIRKCVTETRENVSGNYKGYIFCTGLPDAKEVLKITSNEIKKTKLIPLKVDIKHGCTEFYDKFPEYKEINLDGKQNFNYSKEWETIENSFDRKLLKISDYDEKVVGPTHNKINLSDILIIKNWLKYAKLIGDNTCLDICDKDFRQDFLDNLIKNQINFRKQD